MVVFFDCVSEIILIFPHFLDFVISALFSFRYLAIIVVSAIRRGSSNAIQSFLDIPFDLLSAISSDWFLIVQNKMCKEKIIFSNLKKMAFNQHYFIKFIQN